MKSALADFIAAVALFSKLSCFFTAGSASTLPQQKPKLTKFFNLKEKISLAWILHQKESKETAPLQNLNPQAWAR
jgi:hypothetical protein